MFIRWHGYSCYEFADETHDIIIDPHDGKSIGVFPPKANAKICLCTHNSFDRNAFRMISGKHRDIVCERGEQNVEGFRFEGLPSFSDDKFGEDRGPNTIYLFTMDQISVAYCGCLGDIPIDWVIDRLKGVDILFVPVGEHWTMPVYKVNDFIARVHPKVIVPTDYRIGGITLPLSPLSVFTDDRDEEEIVHVGNSIDLEADDISDFTGVWVFDR
ncbi:MAG: MBL fold metallo-hydrolase [archaeon]|nr:MBL fold metallo-hydrolase [archaeon]